MLRQDTKLIHHTLRSNRNDAVFRIPDGKKNFLHTWAPFYSGDAPTDSLWHSLISLTMRLIHLTAARSPKSKKFQVYIAPHEEKGCFGYGKWMGDVSLFQGF